MRRRAWWIGLIGAAGLFAVGLAVRFAAADDGAAVTPDPGLAPP